MNGGCRVGCHLLRWSLLLLVDVVADHAAQNATDDGADDAAFQLIATRRCADHRTRSRADRRVTLRVLDRDFSSARRRHRSATRAVRTSARAAARAATRGPGTPR